MNATTTADQFPTFKAAAVLLGKAPRATVCLLRWIAHKLRRLFFSRTSLKCYLIMATLICLTYTSLRWVGRRAWEAEKVRAANAGMAADLTALSQPMPPDEDNFLAAPVFGDWAAERDSNRDQFQMWFSKRSYASPPKGINKALIVPYPKEDTLANWCVFFRLTGMLPTPPVHSTPAAELANDQRWKPIIAAVYEASKRPTAMIPTERYNNWSQSSDGIPLLLKSIMLYARGQLEMGNLSEVLPVFRVTNHLCRATLNSGSPFHVFTAIRSEAQLLKTGITLHRWPESTLQELLDANYPEMFQQRCQPMYQQDRLSNLAFYQNFPESWSNPNQLPAWRILLLKNVVPDYFITQAMIRSSQSLVNLHAASAPLGPDENWPSRLEILGRTPPIDLGPELVFGKRQGFDAGPLHDFYWQYLNSLLHVSLRHLAIASELFYLKQSRYPTSLAELNQTVPLPSIAMKDTDGQPIRYSTDKAGTWFTLTSVGYTPFPKGSWEQGYDYHITFSTAPDPQPK